MGSRMGLTPETTSKPVDIGRSKSALATTRPDDPPTESSFVLQAISELTKTNQELKSKVEALVAKAEKSNGGLSSRGSMGKPKKTIADPREIQSSLAMVSHPYEALLTSGRSAGVPEEWRTSRPQSPLIHGPRGSGPYSATQDEFTHRRRGSVGFTVEDDLGLNNPLLSPQRSSVYQSRPSSALATVAQSRLESGLGHSLSRPQSPYTSRTQLVEPRQAYQRHSSPLEDFGGMTTQFSDKTRELLERTDSRQRRVVTRPLTQSQSGTNGSTAYRNNGRSTSVQPDGFSKSNPSGRSSSRFEEDPPKDTESIREMVRQRIQEKKRMKGEFGGFR
jgi:hypothetical protein